MLQDAETGAADTAGNALPTTVALVNCWKL
jgi:hypothetical protein